MARSNAVRTEWFSPLRETKYSTSGSFEDVAASEEVVAPAEVELPVFENEDAVGKVEVAVEAVGGPNVVLVVVENGFCAAASEAEADAREFPNSCEVFDGCDGSGGAAAG